MARYYVTTPIYYVNDVPHIGHAYTTIVADALARFHRLRGEETRFLTGTDEHGQKIERSAAERKMTPQAFTDEVSAVFRSMLAPLNCEADDFIRTTDERHKKVVQELWRKCRDAGFIYEGEYEGLYCVGCEAYYTEKELVSGDGGKLVCPQHRTVPEKLREPSYFFALSKLQDRLLAFYEKHVGFISPESRRNEVLSFVRAGLQDLSISRGTFKWGVPVPDDPKNHVVYVWFDALTNYLSALGEEGGELRRKFWPCDVHLIGKEIVRFHAVYWPAFLMAAGFPDDQLPRKVYAHGWLTINGQKMSKSLRNVVEPLKLASIFGADVVRFYLLREVAFGQDGDFSHAQLVARYNAELADSLGNLLNRTLGLCAKLRPATTLNAKARGPLEDKLEETAKTSLLGLTSSFEEIAPHRAIDATWVLCRAANKYIDEAAPWSEAKKTDAAGAARVDTILASALEVIRWISVMIWPVMPEVSAKIRAQLGLAPLAPVRDQDQLRLVWQNEWSTEKLAIGTPIFPKIDADRQKAIFDELGVSALLAQQVGAPAGEKTEKGEKSDKKKGIAEPAAEVTFDEFARLDLRVGTVLSAEKVPKSDKLLKVQVDLGDSSPRQVVAGIGKAWTPETLVGQQVIVVANLKPAKLMGLESRGMILAVAGETGEVDLALVGPNRPRTAGTRVK